MATLITEHRYTRPLSVRFTASINTLVTLCRFLSASSVMYVHTLSSASFSVAVASFRSDVYHVTSTGGLLGEAWHVILSVVPATAIVVGAPSIDASSAPTETHNQHSIAMPVLSIGRVLEATSGDAKFHMTTNGRGRRPSDELRHPYRLAEGSKPRGIALRLGHSYASTSIELF